jgi:hypothetical protein
MKMARIAKGITKSKSSNIPLPPSGDTPNIFSMKSMTVSFVRESPTYQLVRDPNSWNSTVLLLDQPSICAFFGGD